MKREIKNNEKEISLRENKQLFSLFKYNSWSSLVQKMYTVQKSGRVQTYCVD